MRKAYVSALAAEELLEYLRDEGCEIVLVSGSVSLDSPVKTHPDIYMCSLPDALYFGDSALLGNSYPRDVLYNAAAVGRYLICSRYTSPELIKEASALEAVTVPQGYVKCNLTVLDDHHVISEDRGIARVLKERTDIKCLLAEPGQVSLPGYKYGFIGGASGRLDDTIIFNGDLSAHSNFEDIKAFAAECGLGIKYFESYALTDIGSIIIQEDNSSGKIIAENIIKSDVSALAAERK